MGGAVADEAFWNDPALVRKFDQQTRVLGGMWIFFGMVPVLYGLFWIFEILTVAVSGDGYALFWVSSIAIFICLPGGVMFLVGLWVRRKKQASLVFSLLMGYGILLLCIATGIAWPAIVGLLTVVMSHTCFHSADKLRKQGIPLETPLPESA